MDAIQLPMEFCGTRNTIIVQLRRDGWMDGWMDTVYFGNIVNEKLQVGDFTRLCHNSHYLKSEHNHKTLQNSVSPSFRHNQALCDQKNPQHILSCIIIIKEPSQDQEFVRSLVSQFGSGLSVLASRPVGRGFDSRVR